jgi:hypothetical protein
MARFSYRYALRMFFGISAAFTQIAAVSQNLSSSNLPIIVINTEGGIVLDEPKVSGDMGIIDNGSGQLNNLSDPFNHFAGKIAIEIRGSSSQFFFDKKQFALELKRDNGEDMDTMLLGMPSEEDWILFGPYNDKSLMRDVLAYKLGRDLGRYSPRTRYCELVLNGDYIGVYVLEEKIKRGKNRVDINKLSPDEVSGDDVSGGYIIKIDKITGAENDGWLSAFSPWGPTNSSVLFLYHYPDPSSITMEQKNYIQKFIHEFEHVMQGHEFADPINGYSKYIDVNSFVDFLIINEVAKNVDGYRLSTFFQKQKDSDGGKLVMGPLWDFNLSFGNADYCTSGNPEGLVLGFNQICPDDFYQIPFWWYQLMNDRAFTAKLWGRWNELRSDKLSTESILQYIDSTATALDEAQKRNFVRWPVLGVYVWPNYFVGQSYESEIEWMKSWITSRMNWLDEEFSRYDQTTSTEDPSVNSIRLISYQNPFSKKMEIRYVTAKPCVVEVELYDLTGRRVESTTENHLASGIYSRAVGENIGNGMLVCRMKLDGRVVQTMKVIKE